MMTGKTIGDNIKKYRKAAGMTQDELAEKLNVTRQALSSWETNRTQPDIETIGKIAEALDVEPEELIYNKPASGKTINIASKAGEKGVGLGCVLAVVISYAKWNSILWAIIHGTLGWIYVIYYIMRYR